jgi:hypothetical protein
MVYFLLSTARQWQMQKSGDGFSGQQTLLDLNGYECLKDIYSIQQGKKFMAQTTRGTILR